MTKFHEAAKEGDVVSLTKFLKDKLLVNQPDWETELRTAMEIGAIPLSIQSGRRRFYARHKRGLGDQLGSFKL